MMDITKLMFRINSKGFLLLLLLLLLLILLLSLSLLIFFLVMSSTGELTTEEVIFVKSLFPLNL